MLNKIRTILVSNRFKSFYWRMGMMFSAVFVSGLLSNIDMLATFFSPAVITTLGLILGEISKAINNSLSKK